jgi:hypothetical protein
VVVHLSHLIPLVGLGDRAVTHEHGKWCGSIVPHKEPYFLPPVHGFEHGEVDVRIDAMPGLHMEDHANQNHHFCV